MRIASLRGGKPWRWQRVSCRRVGVDRNRRKAADIFEVQEEISKEISEKLRIKLTGEEKKLLVKRYTDNTEAYRLYLKGRYCLSKTTKEALDSALRYFRQAIGVDPDDALAYEWLADAY